jgi:hypothetical protein
VLNPRFGLPEGLTRAFGRKKSAVCHAGFKYLILAGLGTQNFFKKELARRRAFDIFSAPFARKVGRTACLQTDNCFQQEQE